MKKLLTVLLAVLMSVTLCACGSKKKEITVADYAGKYLMTNYNDDESTNALYQQGWEDKSLYMYLEILEDGTIRIRQYYAGELQDISDQKVTAVTAETITADTGEVFQVKGDELILDNGELHVHFKRTNEIPDAQ